MAQLPLSAESSRQVEALLGRYIVYHLERSLRSPAFLERLQAKIRRARLEARSSKLEARHEGRMQIREYQQWLEAWDQARGWDRVAPAHTLVHALEEMGEVARLVLQWEGYKNAESPEELHAELEEELSDVFVFLFKLAYQTGVDVEAALARGQAKADAPLSRPGAGARRAGALSCAPGGDRGGIPEARRLEARNWRWERVLT